MIRPGRYWSNLDPGTGYFNFVKATCGDQEIQLSVPNVLGGGGSLNFMMYTRGSTRFVGQRPSSRVKADNLW